MSPESPALAGGFFTTGEAHVYADLHINHLLISTFYFACSKVLFMGNNTFLNSDEVNIAIFILIFDFLNRKRLKS